MGRLKTRVNQLREWTRENREMLTLGFLMGATPGICKLIALVFLLIVRALI